MQNCGLDQPSYISFLVDEAIKESDTHNTQSSPVSTRRDNSLGPVPEVNLSDPPSTGDLNLRPETENSPALAGVGVQPALRPPVLQPEVFQLAGPCNTVQGQSQLVTVQPFYVQQPPVYIANFIPVQQAAQANSVVPRHHPSESFRLDQCIGLQETPVVSASQINNKIQVQFQFSDKDPFSVQTSKQPLVNCPSYDSNTPDSVSTSSSVSQPFSGPETSSSLQVEDYSQFLIENILAKRAARPGSSSYSSKVQNVGHLTQGQLQFQHFLLKNTDSSLQEVPEKRVTQTESSTFSATVQNVGIPAQGHLPFGHFLLKKTDSSLGELKEVPVGKCKSVNKCKKSSNRKKTVGSQTLLQPRTKGAGVVCSSNTGVEALSSEQNRKSGDSIKSSGTDKNAVKDFHAESRAYYREYLEFVKKQKIERNSLSELKISLTTPNLFESKLNSKRRLSSKKLLVRLNYECGVCSVSCFNAEELKHHMHLCHFDKQTGKLLERNNSENGYGKPVVSISEETIGSESLVDKMGKKDKLEKDESGILGAINSDLIESEDNVHSETFLCTFCGSRYETFDKLEDHQNDFHSAEVGDRETVNEKHQEEKEYLRKMDEMVEIKRQRMLKIQKQKEQDVNEEQHKSAEETNIQDDERSSTASKDPVTVITESCSVISKEPVSTPMKEPRRMQVKRKKCTKTGSNTQAKTRLENPEPEVLPQRQAASQAKNNLMNPSKGKQKRIRDTGNLNKEDEMLMKMFGIIPSKVCLSRVQDVDGSKDLGISNTASIEDLKEDEERSLQQTRKHGTEVDLTESSKKTEKSCELVFSDNESDIELIEPEVELIVLDEESPVSEKKSVKSSEKAGCERNDVGDKIENDSSEKKVVDSSERKVVEAAGGKSDSELLAQFGMKDVSVKLATTPSKRTGKKKHKIGPKSKLQTLQKESHVELKTLVTLPEKDISEMSQEEIDEMLRNCGMGISIPVNVTSEDFDKMAPSPVKEKSLSPVIERSPSPKPSTSKGHGQLKRKRTARKSTQDSVLFKKFKLKDSKVILKSLSKIDISLMRNPNSSFGKCNWLKHKFDSDTESDFEFDIPTPPDIEEFIDDTVSNVMATQQNRSSFGSSLSSVDTGNGSSNSKDYELMEKFGVKDLKIVVSTPKKSMISIPPPCKINKVSDSELLKKFGIPKTMVVIDSTAEKAEDKITKPYVDSHGPISFDTFKAALDSATKNILGRLKDNEETNHSSKAACVETKRQIAVRRKLKESNASAQTSRKKTRMSQRKELENTEKEIQVIEKNTVNTDICKELEKEVVVNESLCGKNEGAQPSSNKVTVAHEKELRRTSTKESDTDNVTKIDSCEEDQPAAKKKLDSTSRTTRPSKKLKRHQADNESVEKEEEEAQNEDIGSQEMKQPVIKRKLLENEEDNLCHPSASRTRKKVQQTAGRSDDIDYKLAQSSRRNLGVSQKIETERVETKVQESVGHKKENSIEAKDKSPGKNKIEIQNESEVSEKGKTVDSKIIEKEIDNRESVEVVEEGNVKKLRSDRASHVLRFSSHSRNIRERTGKLPQTESQNSSRFNTRTTRRVDENRSAVDKMKHAGMETEDSGQTGKIIEEKKSCETGRKKVRKESQKSASEIENQDSNKNINARAIQVVKTARVKRANILKERMAKQKLKDLTKGMPELKVNVTNLSDQEIAKLTSTAVSSENGVSLEEIVKSLLSSVIDKVCGLDESGGAESEGTSCSPKKLESVEQTTCIKDQTADKECRKKQPAEEQRRSSPRRKGKLADAFCDKDCLNIDSDADGKLTSFQNKSKTNLDSACDESDISLRTELPNLDSENEESDISLISELSGFEGDLQQKTESNKQLEKLSVPVVQENSNDKMPLPESRFYDTEIECNNFAEDETKLDNPTEDETELDNPPECSVNQLDVGSKVVVNSSTVETKLSCKEYDSKTADCVSKELDNRTNVGLNRTGVETDSCNEVSDGCMNESNCEGKEKAKSGCESNDSANLSSSMSQNEKSKQSDLFQAGEHADAMSEERYDELVDTSPKMVVGSSDKTTESNCCNESADEANESTANLNAAACLQVVQIEQNEIVDRDKLSDLESRVSAKESHKFLKRSANIIDKESGDMIGEYYDMGEVIDGETRTKQNEEAINSVLGKENVTNKVRSRSVTPDDVIETLTENT